MASETPWGWIAGGVGVVGLLWLGSSKKSSPRNAKTNGPILSADEKVTGVPLGSGFALRKAKNPNEWASSARFSEDPSAPILAFGGEPLPYSISVPSPKSEQITAAFQAQFAQRRKTLPADASKGWDRYSKEAYSVPNWLMGNHAAGVTAFPVDEFGRIKAGHYGDSGGIWGATFGGLMQNPLFAAAVTTALVVGGGPAGVAALGAYAMWQNRGKELTLKNAAMTAARTYAVSQCGEACGLAFDFGAGVAGGKSVNTAAEDSLYKAMTPEQRAYFDQGKKIVAIVKPSGLNGLVFGGVF